MTFLKPDRRGISVLYVSLSGTVVVILRSCFLLSACIFYGVPRLRDRHKRIPLLSGLGVPVSKENLFQLKPESFLIKLAIPKIY